MFLCRSIDNQDIGFEEKEKPKYPVINDLSRVGN